MGPSRAPRRQFRHRPVIRTMTAPRSATPQIGGESGNGTRYAWENDSMVLFSVALGRMASEARAGSGA